MAEARNYHYYRKLLHEAWNEVGTCRTYMKGNMVYQVGELPDAAYVVKRGRVRLFKVSVEGREIIFRIVNPDEGFGFSDVITGDPRTRCAMAMQDMTELCVVEKDQLIRMLETNTELCFATAFLQAKYLYKYQTATADMANLTVKNRVIQLLLRLTQDYGKIIANHIVIDMQLTHEEIANMVGTSRQTVTSILNDLRDSGFLCWEQKNIKILQLDLLEVIE